MPEQTRVITAAAQRLRRALKRKASKPNTGWQATAWGYWDDTPEVRFAATWIGNSMGRARLFAGYREDDGSISPLPQEHAAAQHVAQIAGGPTGQSQLLTEYGPQLVVAGEGWTVVRPHPDSEPTWHVVSTMELKRAGDDTVTALIDDEEVLIPPYDPTATPDPMAPAAIRVWQPHPRRRIEADSPIRSSFALLEELRLLNAAVAAIAKSRLLGRGILFVPAGAKFPSPPGGGGAEDDLTETLMAIAEIAYQEPDSAAAGVPIIVELPDNFIGQVEHKTFESQFDELAVKLREETIRRFAAGLDTPAEVLLGMGDTNHWGQWALGEDAIKFAVEPRLITVCDAFTEQWLQPALLAESQPDWARCLVWYDASDLRTKVNRAETAIRLGESGTISKDAVRREAQFDDADKPTPEEEDRQLLISIVKGAPSLWPSIAPLLGFQVVDAKPVPAEEADVVTVPEEPAPDIPADEEQSPPDAPSEDDVDEGLLAACDAIVWRALERAGQRLRSRNGRASRGDLQDLDAACVHTQVLVTPEDVAKHNLLEGSWARVPEVAQRYGVDVELLAAALSEYVEVVLTTGAVHAYDAMRDLTRAVRRGERPFITASRAEAV